MSDSNVLKLSQPSTFSDPLTEVLRSGARSLLARAVEAEVAAFLDGHSEARTEEGRRRLVRHGHLPEREIMTGIGPVAVRAPRVRDCTGQGAERIRFSSALLPPYARRSKSLEVLIPVLYLTRQLATIFKRRMEETGNSEAPAVGWVFPSSRSGVGHVAGVGHFHNDISDAGGAKFWFHGLRNAFITVAERELMLPRSLTKRLVNHARPSDVTEGYAVDWTAEQLREPAQRMADRIDELMKAEEAGLDRAAE